MRIRDLRQFFLWTQGQLQALLPHQLMLCLQLDGSGAVQRAEPVHAGRFDGATLRLLIQPVDGLAARLAAHCRDSERLPAITGGGRRAGDATLSLYRRELQQLGFDHLVVHGSGPRGRRRHPVRPVRRASRAHPRPRPILIAAAAPFAPGLPARHRRRRRRPCFVARRQRRHRPPLSAREVEILGWVREGKSNFEIGLILGISAITVKTICSASTARSASATALTRWRAASACNCSTRQHDTRLSV